MQFLTRVSVWVGDQLRTSSSQSFFVLSSISFDPRTSTSQCLGEKEMRDVCGWLRHKRPYSWYTSSSISISTLTSCFNHHNTKGIDHTTYYTPCGATNRPFLPSPPFSSPRPPAPWLDQLSAVPAVAPPSVSFRHCIYVEAPSSSS